MHRCSSLCCAALLFVVGAPYDAGAQEAARFSIPIPNEKIVLARDHYTVELVKGWVYGGDTRFWDFLSDASKIVTTSESVIQPFVGPAITYTLIHDNDDVTVRMSRPWGVNRVIADNIPGEYSCVVTLNIALYRDDMIKKIFSGLKASQPAGLALNLTSWAGYASAVTALTTTLLQTERIKRPFLWSGDIKMADVLVDPGTLRGHYIVLISPLDDHDNYVREMNGSLLSFDDTSQQLRYQGNPIPRRSYVVLRVRKGAGYEIARMAYSLNTPWSTLAQNQFLVAPVLDLTNLDQLFTFQRNAQRLLGSELTFLNDEVRFSSFERAVALRLYAQRNLDAVKDQCARLKIAADACPTGELQQYINNIGTVFFKVPPDLRNAIPGEVANALKVEAAIEKNQ